MNLFLLLFVAWTPQDHQAQFDKANKAYTDGQYDVALTTYEQLLEAGVRSGKLHFNLGNAYYQNDQLGRAILHYLRAQRYMPGDPDIEANLALADSRREDPPIEGEDELFAQTFDRFARGFNYAWTFRFAMLTLIIGGLASLLLIARPNTGKWLGYVLTISATLGLLLTGTAFLQYKQLTRDDAAVLVARQADVYAGPSLRMNVSFSIHAGIRCRILDETEGWYRISLANGYNGWIQRSDLEKI